MSTDNTSRLPLEGIVVLDLGQIYQGPYCSLLLAMAGATVIKIEPLRGEPARLRADTGWTPEIPIDTTLADTLDWWRERVACENEDEE